MLGMQKCSRPLAWQCAGLLLCAVHYFFFFFYTNNRIKLSPFKLALDLLTVCKKNSWLTHFRTILCGEWETLSTTMSLWSYEARTKIPVPLSSLCRDLWVAGVLHAQPDQLSVRQRLLCPGHRLSPPCAPAVQRHQAPPLRRLQLLTRQHGASILQRSLPFGLPPSAQPWDRPHVAAVSSGLHLHSSRRLPEADAARRQPLRTPPSPPGQQPVPGARGRPSVEPTAQAGRRGCERNGEGDVIQRVWARVSEDAVLLPLQRADTDTALHWTVC